MLDVSRSGFYGWLGRPPSRRSREDEVLLTQVKRSVAERDGTYGVRRVWPDLIDWGCRCGRARVGRLMRGAGLVARPRRRRLPRDAGIRPASAIAPNLLGRAFVASEPNQRWVADFTYGAPSLGRHREDAA